MTGQQLQLDACQRRHRADNLIGIQRPLGHGAIAIAANDRPMPEIEYFGKHFVNIPFAVHEVNHTRTLLARQMGKFNAGPSEASMHYVVERKDDYFFTTISGKIYIAPYLTVDAKKRESLIADLD